MYEWLLPGIGFGFPTLLRNHEQLRFLKAEIDIHEEKPMRIKLNFEFEIDKAVLQNMAKIALFLLFL